MKVRELMTSDPEYVGTKSTLRDAASKMKALDVGVMPVLEGENLAGILTDRDIVVRAVAEGLDPNNVLVGEIMSKEVVTCRESDDVNQVAQLMKEEQIRRIPIINDDGMLVGIVSLGDIAVDAEDDARSGDVLEEISTPSRPERH